MDAMETFAARGGFDPAALKLGSDWLLEAGRLEDAIAMLSGVNLVQPLDADLHGTLGEWLLEAGDPAVAGLHVAVLEALDERTLRNAATALLPGKLGAGAEVGFYRLISSMQRGDG